MKMVNLFKSLELSSTMLLKQTAEDFRVEELPVFKLKEQALYAIYKLEKKNIGTEPAISILAKEWKLSRKYISYAGLKDKQAITSQYISILRGKKKNESFKDFSIIWQGYSEEPIALGNLKGNKFTIVVRDVTEEEESRFKKNSTCITKNKYIPNYFDEQRFSINNAEIGKRLIKKEFAKAVELILSHEAFEKSYEHDVKITWEQNKKNPIQALRNIPKKILSLYVNAYQSKLFNEALEIYVKTESKKIKLPMLGFGTVFKEKTQQQKLIKKCYEQIMDNEEITLRDFVVHSFPELSAFGDERDAFCKIDKLTFKELDDELHPAKKKILLTFALPKGSYATRVVKELFC
jgi:tRNA pseudouridine13 synthase